MEQITTKGLSELGSWQTQDVNKRITHYVNQLKKKIDTFEELDISCKEIHKASEDATPIYELKVNLFYKKNRAHGSAEERDLIMAINKACESVEAQL